MIRTALTPLVVFLTGCATINPGNVVDAVDKNNCAVRAVHLEGQASALSYVDVQADGTQVTVLNMKACPGLELSLPSPRDSSKTIDIKIPGGIPNETPEKIQD